MHEEAGFYLKLIEDDLELPKCEYDKIALSELAAYGVSFAPLFSEPGKSGLYLGIVEKGKSLQRKQSNKRFIGASMSDVKAGKGLSQAEFVPVPFDPMMFVFALSLSRIEAHFQEIKNLQKQIMDYLVEQERAKQRSNLMTLIEVQSELKDHWHHPSYRQNKHILIQEIKREANQGILYHRNEIKKILQKKPFLIRNKEIETKIDSLDSEFKEYQLNTYLYGFSTYLELVLLGEFRKETLSKTQNKLNEYSFAYRNLYTESYNYLEQLSNQSLETSLSWGLKEAEGLLKDLSEKVPVQIEWNENTSSPRLLKKQAKMLKRFTQNKQSSMDVFASQIQVMEDAYHQEQLFYVDENYLFLKRKEIS